jgi:hypothetical protein
MVEVFTEYSDIFGITIITDVTAIGVTTRHRDQMPSRHQPPITAITR